MPLAGKPGRAPTILESLVPFLHASFHSAGAAVAAVVTLPGQVLVSLGLIAVAGAVLFERGHAAAAVAWPAAWLATTAVEVLCKHLITRAPIDLNGVHATGFDSSWPSGHTLRCTLVAAALVTAWPRLRAPLFAWLVAALVLLELAGFHTPTDVLGGLLLATVAVSGVVEVERSGLLRRGAALRRARARAG
ncbi:MAG TPA: phosphatase PAP2 family protein [Gaiellaceae bacterium]|jgi:membrane-associated phospholipid phosphatase|nr:phosphatase PAP2 family protein [Gaiellaceae bacterium]